MSRRAGRVAVSDVALTRQALRRGLTWLPPLAAMSLVLVWALTVEAPPLVTAAAICLGWSLLYLSLVDIRTCRLPNAVTVPLLAGGLGVGYLIHPALVFDHLAGAAAGYVILWGIAALYRRWRGVDGLGLGDAKLLAAGGAWTTWQALPSILAYAVLGALLWVLAQAAARRGWHADTPLPFGPFLALGIWLTWLYGPLVWS